MKIFKKLLGTSKRIVGYSNHKNNIGIIKDSYTQARDAIKDPSSVNQDDVTVSSLSSDERASYVKLAKRYSYFFMIFMAIGLINAVVLLVQLSIMPGLFCTAFTLFCAAQVFKYRLTIFQLNNPDEKEPVKAFKAQLLRRKTS